MLGRMDREELRRVLEAGHPVIVQSNVQFGNYEVIVMHHEGMEAIGMRPDLFNHNQNTLDETTDALLNRKWWTIIDYLPISNDLKYITKGHCSCNFYEVVMRIGCQCGSITPYKGGL